MNVADSTRLSSALEQLGYSPTKQIEKADVIVLNTCVVRQSAEDKAVGRLSSLKRVKEQNTKNSYLPDGLHGRHGGLFTAKKAFPLCRRIFSSIGYQPAGKFLAGNR